MITVFPMNFRKRKPFLAQLVVDIRFLSKTLETKLSDDFGAKFHIKFHIICMLQKLAAC